MSNLPSIWLYLRIRRMSLSPIMKSILSQRVFRTSNVRIWFIFRGNSVLWFLETRSLRNRWEWIPKACLLRNLHHDSKGNALQADLWRHSTGSKGWIHKNHSLTLFYRFPIFNLHILIKINQLLVTINLVTKATSEPPVMAPITKHTFLVHSFLFRS
jgi:hypothetical protein